MVLLLGIKNIEMSFKDNLVLNHLNLEARSSDIIGLIGKSGCGKSTLLKILVGYYKPQKGSIVLNDKNVSDSLIELRKITGYTSQENSFYEKLTVIENMRYYANLYNIPLKTREERIKSLLKQVGLFQHKNMLAEKISGGMKRRLDFAISLIHNPDILILDEPTAGLDPLLIDQFWEIVKEVVEKEKKIVIMSSHIISEIEKYCTKAAVMDNGKIKEVFQKKDMKNLEKKFRKIVSLKKGETNQEIEK